MISSTLNNRVIAGFEPTPGSIAHIIAHDILQFSGETTTVLEPTIGVGDLAAPVIALPGVALVGIEQDPERAAIARERFGSAQILSAELAHINLPDNAFSLVLANFPYGVDVEFGFRIEYLMLKQVTAALVAGGVLVSIVPARSGWDDMTIAYMGKRYDRVQAWRFFDEAEDEGERFATFSQMVVVARKRADPLLRAPDEISAQLKGWKYSTGDQAFRGTPPPELPRTPISHPYLVPAVESVPQLSYTPVHEADLVGAAHAYGIHTTSAWKAATETSDRARAPRPLMTYSRTAHIIGGFFTGFLDGIPITANGQTMVFSSFLTKIKARRSLDDAEVQEELAKGAVNVQVYRDEPKFMITALDLTSGVTTFAADGDAHAILQPFLPAIARLVVADQPPIYDPAQVEPWMLRATTAIGAQKRLPGAPHPGLAPAQLHMSYALQACLNTLGYAAEQGKPGTGKTLTTINTMALLALQYRHRPTNIMRQVDNGTVAYRLIDMQKTLCSDEVVSFVGSWQEDGDGRKQWIHRAAPGWIKKLRAAWRHHPHLANAGPRALPMIITCPKRVTRSAWEREIKIAWPQAEVIQVENRADLDRVFARAAESTAPAVIGIIPHSLTRAFTLTVVPDVIESTTTIAINDCSENAAERGEPVLGPKDMLIGYTDRETGQIITTTQKLSVFRCPGCGTIITAPLPFAEDDGEEAPVEDIEWFERQKRTCTNTVTVYRQIDPDTGIDTGSPLRRSCDTPLWKTERVHPVKDAIDFAQWSKGVARKRTWHGLTYDPRYSRLAQNNQGTIVNAHIHTDEGSPFDTLLREYRNCYALLVVDESHNAIGENTDVARSFHHAQRGALMHLYLSGTHYAGTIERFFFYWFRFNPRFWLRFGLQWTDAATACSTFGVVETWVREYEGKANKSTGAVQNRTQVSSRLAPGIDTSLFPYLLASMGFLTIADIGAMMPKRREYPHLVSMYDPALAPPVAKSSAAYAAARLREEQAKKELAAEPDNDQAKITYADARVALETAQNDVRAMRNWAQNRDLSQHYHTLDGSLTDMAKKGVAAAALGKGTLLRWFPTLCMDPNPFSITQVLRSVWGKVQGYNTIITAPTLAADYIYPLERELRKVVHQELKEGRRVMIYIEQAGKRDLHKRLAHVLARIARHHRTGIWALTNDVAATEREAAICAAIDAGNSIVTVPYRLVSEGVNLQRHIDTIVWYELARNRFSQDQASERAYRLGRPIDPATGLQRDVRLHFLAYAGTAGHTKLRKLAGENVAAQLFDGDTPGGELAAWSGADNTPIVKMSASLDEQQRSIAAAFAARDAERDRLLQHESETQNQDPLAIRLREAWRRPAEAGQLWGMPWPRTVKPHITRSGLQFGSPKQPSKKAVTVPKRAPDPAQTSLFDIAAD